MSDLFQHQPLTVAVALKSRKQRPKAWESLEPAWCINDSHYSQWPPTVDRYLGHFYIDGSGPVFITQFRSSTSKVNPWMRVFRAERMKVGSVAFRSETEAKAELARCIKKHIVHHKKVSARLAKALAAISPATTGGER